MKKIVLKIVLVVFLLAATPPIFAQENRDTLTTQEKVEYAVEKPQPQEKKEIKDNQEIGQLKQELEREKELRRGYEISTVVLFIFAFILALTL